MNNIHNNGPDGTSPGNGLDDDLEKLAQAYRQLSSEEPPELLDQAILNSARRAAEAKDHWLDFGWMHGLTTAAVVVLALSIILTQRESMELEENGLSPSGVISMERHRDTESELSQKLPESRLNQVKFKQEASKQTNNELRNDMGQNMPATSSPRAQAGSRAEAVTVRKFNSDVQADFRAKKSSEPEQALLGKDLMQASTPAEVASSKPATVRFADESTMLEASDITLDAAKSDADKIAAKRSPPITEEAQLQAILALKHTGDDSWITELKIFISNYPDYPLPEELKIQ